MHARCITTVPLLVTHTHTHAHIYLNSYTANVVPHHPATEHAPWGTPPPPASKSQIVGVLLSTKVHVDEVWLWTDYERTTLTANSPLTLSSLSLGVLVDMMRRSDIPGVCDLRRFTGDEALQSCGVCLQPVSLSRRRWPCVAMRYDWGVG